MGVRSDTVNRRVLLVIVAVGLVVAAGWWFVTTSGAAPVEFSELCPIDAGDVERVVMRDGSTGEAASSAHTDDIETLFEILNAVQFRPEPKPEQRAGWILVFDLYDTDDSYFRVQFQGAAVKTMKMTTQDGQVGAARSFEMDDDEVTALLLDLYESLPEDW